MGPSTLMDQDRDAACAESLAALHEACRDPALMKWPAELQLSEFARLVSDYALCARAARLRSDEVLAALRVALLPLTQRGHVPVGELIARAIRDYYDGRPQ